MESFKLACVICNNPGASYKCPVCLSSYCSVKCYKEHKLQCVGKSSTTSSDLTVACTSSNNSSSNENQFLKVWEDPKIQKFLQSSSLKFHLNTIYRLLTDQSVTREVTAEGRRTIALKKLRELRSGGREQNEQVEEFVQYFLNKLD